MRGKDLRPQARLSARCCIRAPDWSGLACLPEDGYLRIDAVVDVVPLYGMQVLVSPVGMSRRA